MSGILRARRKRRRTLAIAVAGLCLLGLLGSAAAVLRDEPAEASPVADTFVAPVFLREVSSPSGEPLKRPLGLASDGDRLYVTDALAGAVFVFGMDGMYLRTIGEGRLQVPAYADCDRRTREVFVTDRGLGLLLVFEYDGSFVETLAVTQGRDEEKEELDPFAPLAVEVAEDRSLLVSDVSEEHRILYMRRSGEVLDTFGEADSADPESGLNYPNAVKRVGGSTWVADSNNRRFVEYDRQGAISRVLRMDKVMRGFDILPSFDGASLQIVAADVLSHRIVTVDEEGEQLGTVGEPGGGDGEFAFPNDVIVENGIMYVADTGNARVQMWEWAPDPEESIADILLSGSFGLWPILFLSPIALLPLVRPIEVTVSPETLVTLAEASKDRVWRRVRLVTLVGQSAEEAAAVGIPVLPFGGPSPDAEAFAEELMLDSSKATILALALQSRVLLTEDEDLAVVARAKDVEVVEPEWFVDEFTRAAEESAEESAAEPAEDRAAESAADEDWAEEPAEELADEPAATEDRAEEPGDSP